MKHKLLPLFVFSLLFATSCVKTNTTQPQQPPSGVFPGQFLFVHRKLTVLPYDTLKANLVVTMQTTPSYTFKVTGDTSQHAGSYGTFMLNSGLIYFNDVTYPTNGSVPAKIHLSGTYQYSYNGVDFQLLSTNSDTSAYEYILRKN